MTPAGRSNTVYTGRVCVEVDLNKPLVPRIYLDGQWQPVEYEGLPMICFKCGRSGHRECPYVTKEVTPVNENGAPPLEKDKVASETGKETEDQIQKDFGPWMIAQNRRKRRTPKSTGIVNGKEQQGPVIKGSRYDILSVL